MSFITDLSLDAKTRSDFVASSVVMIFPQSFQSNPETRDSNAFQQRQNDDEKLSILKKAQSEFTTFQNKLMDAGINVLRFTEDLTVDTPDALFPNNWFCHLPDGRIFLFPMQAHNRRREVRPDIIDAITHQEIIDLTMLSEKNHFLEGTGSIILDHPNKIGYACLSPRTTIEALNEFSKKSGYSVISFNSYDQSDKSIYHTNVMMSLSPQTAVINLNSIRNPLERAQVIQSLKNSGRNIVEITHDQMNHFAGNILFLKNERGQSFWVCSERAHAALTAENKSILERDGDFIYAPLDTIETYGGGGARCLLAEVF
jgi:hypothetical protein